MNDSDIPEIFNLHLCGVGKKLSEKFKDIIPPNRSNSPEVPHSFNFREITTHEDETLVKGIKTYKSSAITNLTSCLLKDAFLALIPQLTFLFKCSLSSGVFPSKWKKANVVLLHKGSSKLGVNNYRPISLLPLPGKLLGSIIHGRLLDYFTFFDILSDHQWGFRPGRSMIDASSNLIE